MKHSPPCKKCNAGGMRTKAWIAACGLAVCLLAQPAMAEQSGKDCKTYDLSEGHDRVKLAETAFSIVNDGPVAVVIETDANESVVAIPPAIDKTFVGDPYGTYFLTLSVPRGRAKVTVCGRADETKDAKAAFRRRDFVTAAQLMQPFAQQGNSEAQVYLGVLYAEGLGVSQDYGQALKWFRKSTEQNNPFAQYFLGVAYAESKGVPQDYAEALKWFRKAADQHHAAAQRNIGVIYALGHGVPVDYVQALMWWILAADLGDSDAIKNRDGFASKMAADQIAEARRLAREWLASHPQP